MAEDKRAIKSISENRVGGYLIVFGDENMRDLHNEYFTPDTDIKESWYSVRPLLYQHGHDGEIKSESIGFVDKLVKKVDGWWAEAQIDLHMDYAKEVVDLVKKGVLYWSSGAISHLVDVVSGEIKTWPLIEGSLTPTPAEPRRTNVSQIKAYFKSIGMEYNEMSEKQDAVEPQESDVDQGIIDGQTTIIINNTPQLSFEDYEKATKMLDKEEDVDNNEEATTKNREEDTGDEDMTDKDTNKPEDKKRVMKMEDQLKFFVDSIADVYKVKLNDEGSQVVVDNIKSHIESITGDKDITIEHVKLVMADSSFKEKVEAWIKENQEGAELKALVEEFKAGSTGQGGQPRFGKTDKQPEAPTLIADFALKSQYGNLSPEDKSFYYMVRKEYARIHGHQWAPPDFFMASMHEGSEKTLGEIGNYLITDNEGNRRFTDVPIAVKALDRIGKSLNSGVKANELNHSTNVGFGDEWVATLWQGRLWEQLRHGSVIASMIQTIDMPSNPYKIPLQGDPPKIYSASESTDSSDLTLTGPLTLSRIPTANTEISAHKVGIRSPFSMEITEDSLIQFIPAVRADQMLAMVNGVDYLILNADSQTGNTNINYKGAAAVSGSDYLVGFDGIVKRALITNGGTHAIDGGNATLTLSQARTLHDKLDEYFLDRQGDLVYIVTPRVHTKLKSMDKFLDAEVHSGRITGQFGAIDGIPVVRSFELKDAHTDGSISSTSANNNRGRCLIIYKPHYVLGYRRRIRTWMEYMPANDSYQMGAWARLGFLIRDNVRKSEAIQYNIKI